MGHLTQSVLEGLKGQDLSVSKTHPKSGKPYEKKLAAQQMALLLTVASQQEALPRNNCGEAPAWTADPKTVCDYTHTKSSAFHEDRNFLIELGLLEREKSSYRVCTSKLRNTEPSKSEPPSELRNTESSEKTTDEDYIERVAQSIADTCNIDSNLINLSDVADAIKDKYPNSVYKKIGEIWEESSPAKKVTPTIILTKLRGLPDKDNDREYKRTKEANRRNRRDHGGKEESQADEIANKVKEQFKSEFENVHREHEKQNELLKQIPYFCGFVEWARSRNLDKAFDNRYAGTEDITPPIRQQAVRALIDKSYKVKIDYSNSTAKKYSEGLTLFKACEEVLDEHPEYKENGGYKTAKDFYKSADGYSNRAKNPIKFGTPPKR